MSVYVQAIESFPEDKAKILALQSPESFGLAGKLWISLKAAGDLGPSGYFPEALKKREAWMREQGFSNTGCVLVPRQNHTLRVILLCAGGKLQSYLGTWNQKNKLEILEEKELFWDPAKPEFLPKLVSTFEADGLVCEDARFSLGVTVADCMSLFLQYRKSDTSQAPVRALLHSGWAGTGILAVALKILEDRDPEYRSAKIQLAAGPCIQAADYAVPPERAQLFRSRFGASAVQVLPDGQSALDLPAANLAILAGTAPGIDQLVPEQEFEYSYLRQSTFSTGYFQSFRRDAKAYGRMLAFWSAESRS